MSPVAENVRKLIRGEELSCAIIQAVQRVRLIKMTSAQESIFLTG